MSYFRSLLSFAFVAALLSCGPVEHETISSMSQIVTPPAVPNFPPSLNIPTNGDGLDAAVFKLGVEDPLQAGVEAARLAVLGGGIRRRVKCTGNTSLVINPLGVVVATVGGTTWAVPHSISTTIDPSALVTLAASTRYWVYAQLSAANPPMLSFIVSTDAPTTPGLSYRTGDASALYVSTFLTDGSSNLIPYTQSDNIYRYLTPSLTLLSSGSMSSPTTVALTGYPAGTVSALLWARLTTSSAPGSFQLRTSTASALVADGTISTNSKFTSMYVDFALADGIEYAVGSGTDALTIFLMGFTL